MPGSAIAACMTGVCQLLVQCWKFVLALVIVGLIFWGASVLIDQFQHHGKPIDLVENGEAVVDRINNMINKKGYN